MTTRIVLIRHGQTAWNREARFRGQSDVPLEKFGLEQAEVTGRYVAARWPVVVVYASPLSRTMKTAEAVARAQGLQAQPLEGLIDINFGQLQGLLATEAEERYPDLFRAWAEKPHTVSFPGGESLDIVRTRITAAMEQIVARHRGQSVALVSHTVANRVLLCVVLGWGNDRFWQMHQETCAVNIFDVADDGDFTIVQLNDTGHLQQLPDSEV
jgi:broad specificity phosphatase PhoE